MKHIYKILVLTSILFIGCTKTKKEAASLPEKLSDETSQTKDTTEGDVSKESSEVLKNTDGKSASKNLLESPRLPAVIRAENNTSLSFQSSGVITDINVKAGDFVKLDQVIALLDDTNEALSVESAKLELKSKHIVFNQVQKKYQSYLSLSKTGALSQIALEDEENNFKLAKIAYEASAISLKAKEFALKQTRLTVPFDGVVTKSYKSLGDFVTPGTSVFDIVQSDDFSVYAQVPVAYFGKMKVGMTFGLINPLNEQKGKMTIQKVIPVIDTESHSFDIYGKVDGLSKNFVPGMYVEIILPSSRY